MTLSLIALSVLYSQASSAKENLLTEEAFFAEVPVVLTASRLAQPADEIPVAVTIIDREMIEASGFTEISDLLRLVPGYIAGNYLGNIPVVNNLFMNDSLSRRLQVMVDGRSIYAPSIGGPIWNTLPLNINDIERIEVVRGPNASTYGSNSFLGVINIITRDSAVESGTFLRSNLGEAGLKQTTFRFGSSGEKFSYRLTAWAQENDGYINQFDGTHNGNVSARADYRISDKDMLRMQLGYSESTLQRDESLNNAKPDHEIYSTANFQMLKWEHNLKPGSDFYLKFYHNYDRLTEHFILAVDLSGLGGPSNYPLPVNQNYKSDRSDLEFQMTQELNPELKIAWGGSTRRDTVTSPAYLGQYNPATVTTQRAFINAAWEINKALFMNGGLMAEDTNITDTSYSPSVSLHYRITEHNTLRVAASRANRIPVAFEEFPDTVIQFTVNLPPPITITDQLFYNGADLKAESNTEFNLGLVGQYPKQRLEYDVTLARHKLKDIFGVQLNTSYPDINSNATYFANLNSATLDTLQASIKYTTAGGSRIVAGYAHNHIAAVDNVDPDEALNNATPKQWFSLMGIYKINADYTASLGYYYLASSRYLDEGTLFRPSYNRVDVRLARKIKAQKLNGEIALVGQNITDTNDSLYIFNQAEPRWYASLKLNFD